VQAQNSLAIKVHCSSCETPVAEWQGSVLLIKSKHHGESHVTAIYVPLKVHPGIPEEKISPPA
jgi:hypothetical protein